MADISEAARETARAINLEFDCTRYVDCAIDGIAEHVQKAIDQALASQAAEVERLKKALQRAIASLESIEEELLESPTKETCRLARIVVIDCRVGLRVTLKSTPTPTEAR